MSAAGTAARPVEPEPITTGPAETVAEWADPLYRPLIWLPGRGTVQRFAGVDAEVTVTDTAPDTARAHWLPERAIALAVDDLVHPADLGRALPSFRAYAAALGARSATAMLTLPSRDVDRCRVAREQGFAPYAVLSACPLPRTGVIPAALPAGVTIRPGAPADAGGVAALWCAQAEYAARIGMLRFTPAIAEAIRGAVPDLLAGPDDVLVAEFDGRPIGVVAAAAVAGRGVAERLRPDPTGSLSLACIAPDQRGRGIGGALVREVHRHLVAHGVAAGAVRHSAFNPLAGPFFARHGYRPILTTFVSPL